jgi:hypothetical protein
VRWGGRGEGEEDFDRIYRIFRINRRRKEGSKEGRWAWCVGKGNFGFWMEENKQQTKGKT